MQFSQFYFPFMNFHADETWMLRTIIFFHEKFAKCFSNFEDITFNGSLKIDNETYFWIFNAELKSPLKVSFLKEKMLYLGHQFKMESNFEYIIKM